MQNLKPLILANTLHGFDIHAEDGAIGYIDDIYFNDQSWEIYRIVVDLGRWLPDRKVLLMPETLGQVDWRKKNIEVRMTKEQIHKSPDFDTALPVARQIEKQQNSLFMENNFFPEVLFGMHQYVEPSPGNEQNKDDPHLRSTMILKECSLVSQSHKNLGTLHDFLIDTEAWNIRFLLMKTNDSRFLLAKTDIVQSIEVSDRTITVNHSDDEKNEWQEYDPHYMVLLETVC